MIKGILNWIWRSLTFRANKPWFEGKWVGFSFEDGDHYPSPKLVSFGRYNAVGFKFNIDKSYANAAPGDQLDKVGGLRFHGKGRKELMIAIRPSSEENKFQAHGYVRIGDELHAKHLTDLEYGKEYTAHVSSVKKSNRFSILLEDTNEDGVVIYRSLTNDTADFLGYFKRGRWSNIVFPYIGGKMAAKSACMMSVKYFKIEKI